MKGWKAGYGFSIGVFLFLALGCGRKDVNRAGEIKLRGEKPVSMEGRRQGDLLQKGVASWYGRPYHGRRTANGETYDMWKMTAAHKTLPFGTRVKVLHRGSGKWVEVRINDRGPFVKGRIIDLSRKAAQKLGMELEGTAEVALYLLDSEASVRRDGRTRGVVEEVPLTNGYWTIQAGGFSEKSRAEVQARKLRDLARDVRIRRENGMYKVRVGKFELKADAGRLAQWLVENNVDVWIVHVED